jgi:hypothetical protein
MGKKQVFLKIISEIPSLGTLSALLFYYNYIAVSNTLNLHKKRQVSLYGEIPAFLFIGPLFLRILSDLIALSMEAMPRKAFILIRHRTLVPRVVYNPDDISMQPVSKLFVRRLRRGRLSSAAEPRFRISRDFGTVLYISKNEARQSCQTAPIAFCFYRGVRRGN